MSAANANESANTAPDLPRYRIVGGGEPTPEQLAALAIALTPVARPDDAVAADATSRWALAALREGVGHRTFVAAPDLDGGRFPLG